MPDLIQKFENDQVSDIQLFPCNIETNKVPSTIISLASFGKLNIFNKMWFQEVCVMKMKISNFLKTPFFSIALTFTDEYTLNINNIKEFWSFGTLLAFVGLHWPFWPLWPWIIFLSKNWPLLIKIKHFWPVSNNQMSKSISEGDRAF